MTFESPFQYKAFCDSMIDSTFWTQEYKTHGLLWKFYHCAAKQRIQSSRKIFMNREKGGIRRATRWPGHLLIRVLEWDREDLASGIIFLFCMKP